MTRATCGKREKNMKKGWDFERRKRKGWDFQKRKQKGWDFQKMKRSSDEEERKGEEGKRGSDKVLLAGFERRVNVG